MGQPTIDHNKPVPFRTICEVHREIYRELKARDENDPLIDKIKEAYTMAKKMNNKLIQYNRGYADGWWEANKLNGDDITKED